MQEVLEIQSFRHRSDYYKLEKTGIKLNHRFFFPDFFLDLIDCVFSFCLQSVEMQYYRETESDPDFSSEIKPITPERTEPELESNNKHRSESLM